MGQHIYFGAVANSHINALKGLLLKNADYMDIICHIEHTGYDH